MGSRKSKTSLAILLATLAFSITLPFVHLSRATVSWGTPTQLTNDLADDFHPSMIEAQDRRVWVTWEKVQFFANHTDVDYMVYNSGTWSTPVQLDTDQSNNLTPFVTQLNNGTLITAWSSNKGGNYDIYVRRSYDNGASFGPKERWVSSTLNDTSPSIVQGPTGTVWLFWDRCINPGCDLGGNQDIYYKTYNGAFWTPEIALVTNPASDWFPSATSMKDGSVWLAYSRYTGTQRDDDIFYRVWRSGTWGTELTLTNTAEADLDPAFGQSRDGTIWASWTRQVSIGGGNVENDVYYKTTINNGTTWTTDAAVTVDPNGRTIEDQQPAIMEGRDGLIWILYSSTLSVNEYRDLWLIKTNQAYLAHDVSMIYMSAKPLNTMRTLIVIINATVRDTGDYAETLNLTLTATGSGNTVTISKTTLTLSSGETRRVPIYWNTSNAPDSPLTVTYQITGSVSAVPGESTLNQSDNSLIGPSVIITPVVAGGLLGGGGGQPRPI